METKIQLQKNANVFASDGLQVGSLNRVVVNPNTMMLTDIVVRTGALFNQIERVVPVKLVAETTEDQIVLREEAGDLAAFPPFEEEHIVDTEENMGSSSPGGTMQSINNGSPIFGIPSPTTVGEKFVTRVDQNIPEGTVAMKEGARVMSADGKHVGNVERVFTGVPAEQVTHLLISRGKIKKKTKLVPATWVKFVNEEKVYLRVQKVSVDNLADTSILV